MLFFCDDEVVGALDAALLLSASCGFVLPAARLPAAVPPPRSSPPAANLFENLSKIAEYNKKYLGTAFAALTDDRKARASHILFGFKENAEDAEARARDVKSKLDSGEIEFESAASTYSSCPSAARGGDLGEFKRGAMVPEFDEAVFTSEQLGQIIGPIKTQFGWHIIRVDERSEAA
eukprot:CAMPEP_0185348692 /NCGR_PEP_ID=MMETSP1364-20130426/1884_1 /TAXON_ID=38817 /ORGANISM="Gephyrocapsa oceanica, Strain RCC1303" /LENGTH=176 /DNA_ID=CAMNT_0027948147 /DNA_START=6 /DNA_END=536 /DNA_ORIENTATION=-